MYAFYARDQWQVSRKFTVSYGIRYELYPLATRDHYGADIYNPNTGVVCLGGLGGAPKDCGVNVGHGDVQQLATWLGRHRFNDKTVLRAGYGISVDPNSYRAMRDAYPATIAESISGATSFQAAGTLTTGIPAIVGPNLSGNAPIMLPTNVTTTTFPMNYKRGYIESLNVTLQRELAKDFTAQAAFVSTKAIRHTDDININPAGPGGGVAGQYYYPITGQTTAITESTPFSTSNYNALQTQMIKRLGGGMVGASYTYSKAMDFGDNDDSGLTWAWAPMLERNYALAGFDRTHNFQLFSNYGLPFGHGKQWLSSGIGAAIAGGWQLNGILSRESGLPFTVGSAGTSVNAPGNTQTANQVMPNVAHSRRPRDRRNWRVLLQSDGVRPGHRRPLRQ